MRAAGFETRDVVYAVSVKVRMRLRIAATNAACNGSSSWQSLGCREKVSSGWFGPYHRNLWHCVRPSR